jgi:hypothetical protein
MSLLRPWSGHLGVASVSLLTILAALAAFTAQPAASAQPAAPASDATITRFMAAVPPASRSATDRTPDPQDLARYNELNPGRAAEVRAALEEHEGCIGPIIAAGTERILRNIARELGEERVVRLTRFYESQDSHVFDRLSAREESSLTEAERAEMDRIVAAYPLTEFLQEMANVRDRAGQDQVMMNGLSRCAAAMQTDFERRRLREE